MAEFLLKNGYKLKYDKSESDNRYYRVVLLRNDLSREEYENISPTFLAGVFKVFGYK